MGELIDITRNVDPALAAERRKRAADLERRGMVRLVGFDALGEPVYEMTELGDQTLRAVQRMDEKGWHV